MKRTLSLILALLLCLCLLACDRGTQNPDSDNEGSGNTDSINTPQTDSSALVLHDDDIGVYINQERFHEIVTTVELTVENWAEYIEVCTYTKEVVTKDAFDEIVSTETVIWYELGAKNEQYYHFRDFVIELKNKSTGELETYRGDASNGPNVSEDFNLDEYECTRIKGMLYLIDVPEEAIFQLKDGDVLFNVRYPDPSYGPYMSCFIYGRRVGGMFDFFAY